MLLLPPRRTASLTDASARRLSWPRSKRACAPRAVTTRTTGEGTTLRRRRSLVRSKRARSTSFALRCVPYYQIGTLPRRPADPSCPNSNPPQSRPDALPFEDLVFGGTQAMPAAPIDDAVLLKADGFPTYHFANVVDDYEMGITHVLRGEVRPQSASCLRDGTLIIDRAALVCRSGSRLCTSTSSCTMPSAGSGQILPICRSSSTPTEPSSQSAMARPRSTPTSCATSPVRRDSQRADRFRLALSLRRRKATTLPRSTTSSLSWAGAQTTRQAQTSRRRLRNPPGPRAAGTTATSRTRIRICRPISTS
jgi:hypothetical protein